MVLARLREDGGGPRGELRKGGRGRGLGMGGKGPVGSWGGGVPGGRIANRTGACPRLRARGAGGAFSGGLFGFLGWSVLISEMRFRESMILPDKGGGRMRG